MNKKVTFIGSILMLALVLIFSRQLLFYMQVSRLKKHFSGITTEGTSTLPGSGKGFRNIKRYSKVWAHRVNTLERFRFLSDHFQGFELDIVFDEQKKYLDVRHPPAVSIALSFEKYLQAPEGKEKYFWLDIKNLTNGNVQAILACLATLDERYGIRNRVIIESGNIAELGRISVAGYFTSYNYDRDTYDAFTKTVSRNDQDSVFNLIDAVSQDVVMYDTLVKRFPSKQRLTWALSVRNYFSDSLFNALDKDEKLLVYLVNIKSPGYR